MISNRTALFLTESAEARAEARAAGQEPQPFFTWIGVPAAHGPFTPAPQYINVSEGELAPRFPNYNMVSGIHSDTKDTNVALIYFLGLSRQALPTAEPDSDDDRAD